MIDRNPSNNDRQFLKDIHSIAESLKIITNLMAAEHASKMPKKELKDSFELVEHIIGDDRK
jgi:hypothetical protein